MTKDFEILEHTAELKIRAYGETKEALFANMMRGMTAAMQPKVKSKNEKVKRTIRISSIDINTLLVDFLSEALYLTQVKREVYHDVKFKKFSEEEVTAELVGEKIASFGEDIKAVTYHGVDIKQNLKGLWEVEVIYDI